MSYQESRAFLPNLKSFALSVAGDPQILFNKFLLRKASFSRRTSLKSVRQELDTRIFLVVMRLRETPVPIPNTMVKPWTADGTALETVWESRWLPE